MEKTVKVRTVIGVVVEMPESIYEANKNFYTLVKEKENKIQEDKKKVITDTSIKKDDVKQTVMKKKKK